MRLSAAALLTWLCGCLDYEALSSGVGDGGDAAVEAAPDLPLESTPDVPRDAADAPSEPAPETAPDVTPEVAVDATPDGCASCNPCERCAGGTTCEIERSSLWEMVVVSARLADKNPAGGDWDPAGELIAGPLPDAQASLEMPPGTVRQRTGAIIDYLTPNWDENLTLAGPVTAADLLGDNGSWLVRIVDYDGAPEESPDMCVVDGPASLSDLRAGGFARTVLASCHEVTLGFNCYQPAQAD